MSQSLTADLAVAHAHIFLFLLFSIMSSTWLGFFRIYSFMSSLLDCLDDSIIPSSQEHFPVILSTSSHIDSLPIKSTTFTSEISLSKFELMLLTVSMTILCCDCLPVKNNIWF